MLTDSQVSVCNVYCTYGNIFKSFLLVDLINRFDPDEKDAGAHGIHLIEYGGQDKSLEGSFTNYVESG